MEILLLLDRRSDTFFSGTCVVQVECVNALDGEMKQKGMDPKRWLVIKARWEVIIFRDLRRDSRLVATDHTIIIVSHENQFIIFDFKVIWKNRNSRHYYYSPLLRKCYVELELFHVTYAFHTYILDASVVMTV